MCCKEVKSGREYVFERPDLSPQEFLDFSKQVTTWVFHNGLGFDYPTLVRYSLDTHIRLGDIRDTLVCSRLLNYSMEGGHSLEAYGTRFGIPKGLVDFSTYSPEMKEYCLRDLEITLRLYKELKPYFESDQWKESLHTEHTLAWLCTTLTNTGFHFDYESAQALRSEIEAKLKELDDELANAFPPKSSLIREIVPKATKHGTISRTDFRWLAPDDKGVVDLSPFSPGAAFSLVSFNPFNPGSPKQIVERLNSAGWKPYEKTTGHIEAERKRDKERLKEYQVYGWKVSEANLATLPDTAPEPARKLVQRLTIASRLSDLDEWFQAYSHTTGRIHGTFNHIGSWTGRMSHNKPNMANIPSARYVPKVKPKKPLWGVEGYYGCEMRSLWSCPAGKRLIGVDAESIQLRVLAHYMEDHGFTKAISEGKSDDGTDAHTLNMSKLGSVCKDRDTAKTFIYAWLLGAGEKKTADILECSLEEAIEARRKFLEAYPGLKHLREVTIPRDAKRGYFIGFDKRLVLCDNNHKMLSGYLQNGEKVIMAKALSIWYPTLKSRSLPFKFVNFVHDEFVLETEDDDQVALEVKKIVEDSIYQAGVELGLKCPQLGTGKMGYNWLEVH